MDVNREASTFRPVSARPCAIVWTFTGEEEEPSIMSFDNSSTLLLESNVVTVAASTTKGQRMTIMLQHFEYFSWRVDGGGRGRFLARVSSLEVGRTRMRTDFIPTILRLGIVKRRKEQTSQKRTKRGNTFKQTLLLAMETDREREETATAWKSFLTASPFAICRSQI
jgi:hypothetical protein